MGEHSFTLNIRTHPNMQDVWSHPAQHLPACLSLILVLCVPVNRKQIYLHIAKSKRIETTYVATERSQVFRIPVGRRIVVNGQQLVAEQVIELDRELAQCGKCSLKRLGMYRCDPHDELGHVGEKRCRAVLRPRPNLDHVQSQCLERRCNMLEKREDMHWKMVAVKSAELERAKRCTERGKESHCAVRKKSKPKATTLLEHERLQARARGHCGDESKIFRKKDLRGVHSEGYKVRRGVQQVGDVWGQRASHMGIDRFVGTAKTAIAHRQVQDMLSAAGHLCDGRARVTQLARVPQG
jgi:hypothetical protein